VRSAGCGLGAGDEEVERATRDVRLLRGRVRLVLPAKVVALELDRRVTRAQRERLDGHVDGPPVRPRGRRVGRAVIEQAVEQGGLAHLGVAEEHEHAGAGDGGAGLEVSEVGADGVEAALGDGAGRQLEGVAAHI